MTIQTTSTSATWTTARRVAFDALLALTMAASTFAFTTFSVLSQSLLETFSLNRWQLGALVTATATVGALTSPTLGKVSDRVGGRRSLQITLGLSAFVLAGIAVSPAYLLLVIAALAAGLAQATANPSTNKLIGDHVAAGARGTVTGIKQAGVQAGVFLGGSLLPLGALRLGWRPTLLIAAVVPLLGLAVSQIAIPADPDTPDGDTSSPGHANAARSPFLIRLAIYGFLIGAGWSALFTYLPDGAQNALGWRAATAGFVVSVAGVCGVVGRIAGALMSIQAMKGVEIGLGFEAARGLCTMLVAPDIPPNHGSVLVMYEGSRYVVDASILHSEPLRLDPDAPSVIMHPAWGVQCEKRDGQWYIRWRSMFSSDGLDCRFEAMSVTRDTFRERYEAARAWGLFNYELHFRLIRGEAIVGAARGERVEFDRGGACVRTPLDDAERRRFLIEDLGIHEAIVQRLPADTPTPPPPWSRTAQSKQR